MRLTGTQTTVLLVVVGALCVGILAAVAFLPAPASSALPCPGCGRSLGSEVSIGAGASVGSPAQHQYCFPVTSVKATVWLYLIDAGIRTPAGAWVATDANFTLTYVSTSGQVVASYQFLGANASADDYSGWTQGGRTVVTSGAEFCLGTGAYDESGDSFVLAGNSFSPSGFVAQPIP